MRQLAKLACALSLIAAPIFARPAHAQDKLGMIEITGSPRERPGDLAWLLGSSEPTLRDITEAIEDSGNDKDLSTIVIRLKDAELNRTQVEEIGTAMRAAHDAGKKVVIFSENYDAPDLMLASYADKGGVYIQSGGEVSLTGLHMQEIYLADTLAWLGVKADFVQIGDYKGADEMFVNAQPSKAWDQNISQLLDSLYASMRQHFEDGRHLSGEQLDQAMQIAWMADADEAIAAGLIDKAVDLPELGKAITGKDNPPDWVDIDVGDQPDKKLENGNPFTAMAELMKLLTSKPPHTPTGPTIAVVHIDGPIADGDSSRGGFLGGEGEVGSRTIRNALEEIRDEDQVKGVIVRIDSPGGSAVASEVIWQGVKRVSEKKPVWVSVGSMAASGGYYIAVAGSTIYIDPSSIVGSIGVVGGKFALGGLLDKLHIHIVDRTRGPMAEMESMAEPWTPEQLAQVRGKMRKTFDLFQKRVSAGRDGIDLSKTAGGWLFSGQKAIDMKMADAIGTQSQCIEALATSLSLDKYDIMDYPGPKGIQEMLEDMFDNSGVRAPRVGALRGGGAMSAVASDVVSVLRAAVGPRAWPSLESSIGAVMQLREHPVILAMPRALIVR